MVEVVTLARSQAKDWYSKLTSVAAAFKGTNPKWEDGSARRSSAEKIQSYAAGTETSATSESVAGSGNSVVDAAKLGAESTVNLSSSKSLEAAAESSTIDLSPENELAPGADPETDEDDIDESEIDGEEDTTVTELTPRQRTEVWWDFRLRLWGFFCH